MHLARRSGKLLASSQQLPCGVENAYQDNRFVMDAFKKDTPIRTSYGQR
jgi:hypothetical protein